jgi:hypothetical protein
MLTAPQFLPANLTAVRRRVVAAAERAGRRPESVTLIGVSKAQPVAVVAAAQAAGLADFGENYVQEALDKLAALPRAGVTWHFIGPLQSIGCGSPSGCPPNGRFTARRCRCACR